MNKNEEILQKPLCLNWRRYTNMKNINMEINIILFVILML